MVSNCIQTSDLSWCLPVCHQLEMAAHMFTCLCYLLLGTTFPEVWQSCTSGDDQYEPLPTPCVHCSFLLEATLAPWTYPPARPVRPKRACSFTQRWLLSTRSSSFPPFHTSPSLSGVTFLLVAGCISPDPGSTTIVSTFWPQCASYPHCEHKPPSASPTRLRSTSTTGT